MPKRITNLQKEELKLRFLNGEDIETLSKHFGYSKLTISRNLKKILGEEVFNISRKNIKNKFNEGNKGPDNDDQITFLKNKYNDGDISTLNEETFFEIVPLNENFEEINRKDLSSVSIDEVTFPKVVYMIVDNKIELKIKTLREYPQWLFLAEEELDRKTIQIFNDLKDAKRECSKENKVIKIPNTSVLKTVAKILTSRGISKIISDDQLISL